MTASHFELIIQCSDVFIGCFDGFLGPQSASTIATSFQVDRMQERDINGTREDVSQEAVGLGCKKAGDNTERYSHGRNHPG